MHHWLPTVSSDAAKVVLRVHWLLLDRFFVVIFALLHNCAHSGELTPHVQLLLAAGRYRFHSTREQIRKLDQDRKSTPILQLRRRLGSSPASTGTSRVQVGNSAEWFKVPQLFREACRLRIDLPHFRIGRDVNVLLTVIIEDLTGEVVEVCVNTIVRVVVVVPNVKHIAFPRGHRGFLKDDLPLELVLAFVGEDPQAECASLKCERLEVVEGVMSCIGHDRGRLSIEKVVEWEGGRVEERKREREAARNMKCMARRNQGKQTRDMTNSESANEHPEVKEEIKPDLKITRAFSTCYNQS